VCCLEHSHHYIALGCVEGGGGGWEVEVEVGEVEVEEVEGGWQWGMGEVEVGGRGIGGKDGRKEQVTKLWNQICHYDHANSTMNTDTTLIHSYAH